MSLWTLLKYKVPSNLNEEEILLLPEPIVLEWWKKTWLEMNRNRAYYLALQPQSKQEVINTYLNGFARPKLDHEIEHATNLLKEAMLEYEE